MTTNTDSTYRPGDNVIITKNVTRCLAEIPAGETGDVIDVDPELGDLVILFHNPVQGLEITGNTIWLPRAMLDVIDQVT
jgi:hypothetical protein